MRKYHPKNERVKREYFSYLEGPKRKNATTIDQVAAAIRQFEISTNYKDFALFHIEQARAFKRQLSEAINPATGKPLAKQTTYTRQMALKAFFQWLALRPGYKSKLNYDDAEYFNPSNHDTRIAKAVYEKHVPSLEQIHHVLASMPATTAIEKRDKAVIAFTLLTGARDNAVASMLIGKVNLSQRRVFQDARDIRTKGSKTFTSDFFPVGETAYTILAEWIEYLTHVLFYGPSDPLFPATQVGIGPSGHFEALGLSRHCWRNAAAIRRIFKTAFTSAGLPYFNPHSFRDCLVDLGNRICTTPEEYKAWSQNFGHEHIATTLRNYGPINGQRQTQIMERLATRIAKAHDMNDDPEPEEVARVMAYLNRKAG